MRIQRMRAVALLLGCFICPSMVFAQPPAKLKPPPRKVAKTSAEAPQKKKDDRKRRQAEENAQQRAGYLRAIAKTLEIGLGDTIADIGAGQGRDSWVFADIVGEEGVVFSEEIDAKKVDGLKKAVGEKKLTQVRPILGQGDSPKLPESSVDMAFMHYVYHHMDQPRAMLKELLKCLKPGGYLVIVDRHRGTLQDWVPREKRTQKHFWIAETTVVREARESGFLFDRYAEECWPMDDQFVIVLQRPKNGGEIGTDPDPMKPLSIEKARDSLATTDPSFQRPAFVALGPARELIGPVMEYCSGTGVDIALEEWATRKDERPEKPAGVNLESVLTEKGKVDLGSDPIDIVFFFDTYHLLFHHKVLLSDLFESLKPGGVVCVLDREADKELSHREASHRRMISKELVETEMKAAGFELDSEPDALADDRFFLLFVRP